MKHKTVFGVGTARYMGLTLPHFVDEEDHTHDHFVVDSPLCCGIVRWDIRDKVRHHYIHAHSDSITCLLALKRVPYLVHPPKIISQLTLSASFGGEVATWDASDWSQFDLTSTRLTKVMHMSVNYEGNKICVTSEENGGLISILSLSDHGKLNLLYEISGQYLCAEFNKKDNIVAIVQTKVNNQYEVKIVEIDSDGKILNSTLLEGHLEGLIALARGKRIDVIHPDSLQIVWVTQPQVSGWIKDFLFYENDLVIPSDRGTLVLWRKTEQIKVWEVSCSMVFSLAWSKKGKTIWMGDESGIHYINLDSLKDTLNVMYHEMTCCGVDFSYSGDLIACGDFGGQVLVWDFNTHKPVHSVRLGLPVRSISWRGSPSLSSLSNPIIIGLMDGSIYSWILNPQTANANSNGPAEPKLIANLKDGVTSLSWEYSPNPSFLAAGSIVIHSCIMAHKPADEVNVDFGSLHKFAEIWSLCWSPDNKFIATASEDQKTRIWNVETGKQVTELCGHTSAVTCVDWQITKVGNLLATCGDDRTIMIWDATTFKLYHTFETKEIDDWHTATYLALEKGGNGTRIVCVTQNGWLMMWDIETKKKLVGKRFHMGSIEGLKWNHPASLLVTCASDCAINVFDASI